MWGELDIADTDCGDLHGLDFTGAIKNKIVTITVSTRCKSHDARLGLTQGELGGGKIEGAYSTFVDGYISDRGSLLLER